MQVNDINDVLDATKVKRKDLWSFGCDGWKMGIFCKYVSNPKFRSYTHEKTGTKALDALIFESRCRSKNRLTLFQKEFNN